MITTSFTSMLDKLHQRFPFFRPEAILAIFAWGILLGMLIWVRAHPLILAACIIVIPTAILLYLIGFAWLIPVALRSRYPFLSYLAQNAALLFIILMGWGLFLKLVIGGDQAHMAALWIYNSVLQLLITIPITWTLNKRHRRNAALVSDLQKELGQSTARMDLLRAQINPHFLFNALNTIYGTALQERAERTGLAVQKLGDMMRFILHENNKEHISLSRELEYLKNYIDLQALRTATNEQIVIERELPDEVPALRIAPMLLIPFVENAFKHGISFRKSSHIRIRLTVEGTRIHFSVENTVHHREGADPEADKSGIGLQNVRARLQLLYPQSHTLLIDEGADLFHIALHLETA